MEKESPKVSHLVNKFIKDSKTPSTLIELLRQSAAEKYDHPAYTFLIDGETEIARLTNGELDRQARVIGGRLQSLGAAGERLVLVYPPGPEYIAAFFGCLYAGAVPVPAYPPRLNQSLARLQAIVADAQVKRVLTVGSIMSRSRLLFAEAPFLKRLQWITTDDLSHDIAGSWTDPGVKSDSLALLQYTSGSTSTPKGVMVTHQNLLHNQRMIKLAFQQSDQSVIVSWLPLYHDMGLIGGILQPLYLGAHCILISPIAFLQRPFRWLQAISQFRATTSGAPDFAYDLCVRKITADQRSVLNLSSWQVAFNGSEPVRPETLERFSEAFEPCGFRREAFYPCYGLAENTLLVAARRGDGPVITRFVKAKSLKENRVELATPNEDDARSMVSCGSSVLDQNLIVVNPETMSKCSDGEIGEIWISGPSVARGYWNNPSETERIFHAQVAQSGAGHFLRTGDLGFLHEKELFITGRLKDLIIIRGLNHYPQDIEYTVERSHPALRPSCGAAFSVEIEGREELVVVQEVETRRKADPLRIIEAIRKAVAVTHEIPIAALALIRQGSIPKTSSGKIQRQACRAAFLADGLDVVTQWRAPLIREGMSESPIPARPESDVESAETWLISQVAALLRVKPSEIDQHEPISSYGIDSLSAIELMHNVETRFGLSLPMAVFLKSPSVSELAARILGAGEEVVAPITKSGGAGVLSHGQRALWFLHRLAPDSPVYNLAFAARVHSKLEVGPLRRAFQSLVNRHSSLRATFSCQDGEPIQHIGDHQELYFQQVDASGWNEQALREYLVEAARSPFDLERGPLLRITLITHSASEPIFLLVIHHITSDYWSLAALLQELSLFYEAERSGRTPSLPPVEIEYRDYVQRQMEMLNGPEGARLSMFWRSQLAGDLPVLDLPTDRPRPAIQSYRGRAETFDLDPDLTAKLQTLSRSNGATLYMTLLAAFQTFLYRYCGQEDFLIGSPTAGRTRADVAGLIGYLVNLLVLRADLSGQPSFRELLQRARETTLAAFEHQDYPFSLLVQQLQPDRDASRSPLFDVAFALQSAPLIGEKGLSSFVLAHEGTRIKLRGLELESIALEQQVAQFDLTMMVAEAGDTISGSLRYSTDLFDRATVRRMIANFRTLLEGVVADPDCSVAELPILSEAEWRMLVFQPPDTGVSSADRFFVHELVATQAGTRPDAVAVTAGKDSLTYRELNEQANRLACYLRERGVGVEQVVGLLMERNVDLIVGLLAIIKAGAAFLPLDPAYPEQRIRYLIEDSGATAVITRHGLEERLGRQSIAVIRLDQEREKIKRWDGSRPEVALQPENLAYTIYTSGSTGEPKGVMIERLSLMGLVNWHIHTYDAKPDDRMTQLAGFGFDAAVWEIWPCLAVGACLHLVPDEVRAWPSRLQQWLIDEMITVSFLPTPLAEDLISMDWRGNISLRAVLTGGDRLRFYPSHSIPFELVNHYGPTEYTVVTTSALIRPDEEAVRPPTIGRPISNTQVYILNDQLQPAPIGVSGELCISGEGLARGYLNRPDLAAERFLANAFSRTPGRRFYRTGDLGRRLPDGTIEFLGRRDYQVKLRGHRIELGEIEAALLKHESVKEAVTLVKEDGGGQKRIVAYVVAHAGQSFDQADLRRYLKRLLPDYMLPATYVELEQLPCTVHGKLDRKALSRIELPLLSRTEQRTSTLVEELLTDIWRELLGLEEISPEENFFELGGHSLLAAQIISRIRERFNIELPLRKLFQEPTITALAESLEKALSAEVWRQHTVIERGAPEEALSFAQQRLWFLDQLEPKSAFYNVAGAVRLRGALKLEALEKSFQEVVNRHEILRTNFVEVEGKPIQKVRRQALIRLGVVDLSEMSEPERELEASRLADSEGARGFDLARDELLRVMVIKLAVQEHVLSLTMHHIVTDGWSIRVLLRELSRFYRAYLQGDRTEWEALKIQYRDYVSWQRRWSQGEEMNRQLEYWGDQLGDGEFGLEIPGDRVRPAVLSHRGGSMRIELSPETSEQVRRTSRREGVTVYMTLLAALKVLLHRYTGQQDITVGSPIANRRQKEVEELIGLFANTVVLRSRIQGEESFQQVLKRVRETSLGAYAHQDVPFEAVVERVQPQRDLSRTPLFQVMFAYENNRPEEMELEGVEASRYEVKVETSRFDLTIYLEEGDEKIRGTIEYSADLFDERTVGRMIRHYETLLRAATSDPGECVSRLPLMGPEELDLVLVEWNRTEREYGAEACIHELFESQVERTPDRIALIFEDERVSYGELNRRANQLAHYLRRLGVKSDSLVAISVERSLEMVVGLFAILKAGGAYVPLDPSYPAERLAYMLKDSAPVVVLTAGWALSEIDRTGAPVIDLEVDAGRWTGESETNPDKSEVGLTPDHLAYVIYTSGSTGSPKGAMNEHRSVLNRLLWMQEAYGLNGHGAVLQKTPFSFDVSVWEFFWPLLAGSKLVLARAEGHKDPTYLADVIQRQRITTLHFVPSMLQVFLEHGDVSKCSSLVRVITSGEALPGSIARSFRERLSHAGLYNLYGPTEAAVDVTAWAYDDYFSQDNLPIGRPVANTRIHLLDSQGQLVPIGVAGEIHIGGIQVARGYWNRPELTAEKFIPNSHPDKGGSRLYRTGDIGRYLSDGNLQFLGRGDHQVKLRGFRIELGEIESVLRQHPEVKDAVVVVREDESEKRIVAYIVPKAEGESLELREYLKQKLPEYMAPSAIVMLEALPLTPNGKIDRKALPAPQFGAEDAAVLSTPVEEMVAGVWRQVLNLEEVGADENFFEIGGHSLLATQVISRARELFGVELEVRRLFETPTIAGLGKAIEREIRSGQEIRFESIIGDDTKGAIPLSPAQERLWFLDQLEPKSAFYNVAGAVRLRGALKLEALEKSFQEVANRHEILRTNFVEVEGKPIQKVRRQALIRLGVVDLSEMSEPERELEASRLADSEGARGFDLARDELLRVMVIKLAVQEHLLSLTMHHIVTDGWSIRVLLRELSRFYRAYLRGDRPEPEALKIQYRDYVGWQRRWLQGEEMNRQLEYWGDQLGDGEFGLEIPGDRVRPAVLSHRGGSMRIELSPETSEQVRRTSRREGVTVYMTLLAALKVLLHKYTGQQDITVGSPIANRRQKEVEELIGLFANTVVLRSRIQGEESFQQILKRVRETSLGAYAHQDVPFEAVVERLQPQRDLSRTPLFQVMFAYENNRPEEMELEGVEASRYEVKVETSRFDLTIYLEEGDEKIRGTIEYSADLFDERTVGRMIRHYETLLRAATSDPGQCIDRLPLMGPEELDLILVEWNGTEREYGAERCIHELFESQVERTPDRIALIFEDERVSYGELNRRANQLAHYLRRRSVWPEVFVAICLKRSIEMVVSMLAVHKAGGAYVPIDPSYPEQRRQFMLEDSRAMMVLTQSGLNSEDLGEWAQVVDVDGSRDEVSLESIHNVETEIDGSNLAYVIYTSGSTGVPKGVGIQHRSAATLLHWAGDVFSREELAGTLASTSICFDLSVYELFAPLSHGGKVILAENALQLPELLAVEDVTLINTVPSAMAALSRLQSLPSSVTTINLAGEPLHRELVDAVYSLENIQSVYNLYGPSEDTTYSTYCLVSRDNSGTVTIGRPISNTQIYVLDGQYQPLPIGVSGEICISGEGLARGYINRPASTAEKFIPNPQAAKGGSRMYRTGDIGRYLSDGNLQFLGRGDHQVKLRGFRIELGEIESVLRQHAEVKEAVVVVREDESEKRIVAYIVPKAEGASLELREYLKRKLPEYMTPSAIIMLEALPLTPNGKIDRKALPAPQFGAETAAVPTTPVEEMLAGVWRQVLNLEEVGADENFFEVGGHSLLATQLISRTRELFGVEIGLRRLFESPTVRGLAQQVEIALRKGPGLTKPALRRADRSQRLPLSFAQQRLWFIDQLEPGSALYNIPAALRLYGELNVAALERSLQEIARRHEALRTSFRTELGEPWQVISEDWRTALPVVDLSHLTADKRMDAAQQLAHEEAERPFDLSRGPLWRCKLLRLAERDHVFIVNLHHIISDEWSKDVLTHELATLYKAYTQGAESPLPELEVQYADFAIWQREWLRGPILEQQLAYWSHQLTELEPLNLPTDHLRPAVASHRGASAPFSLSDVVAAQLNAHSRREGVTMFILLLAAFKVLLHRYSGQREIIVGTPISNRQNGELEGLIGFFVNTLALRTELWGGLSFKELVSREREIALGAYAHQDLPFEILVEQLRPERSFSHTPLFQVLFVLQYASQAQSDFPGLSLESLEVHTKTTKFDLTLFLFERQKGLRGQIEYSSDLFEETTITRMISHFESVLVEIALNPNRRIDEFSILTQRERLQIIDEWNQTKRDLNIDRSATELLEEEVEKRPDAIAVVYRDSWVSFGELNRKANRLAHHLISKGVKVDEAVGLCASRGIEMVVGVIGILKTGGCYAPLDPLYPSQRLLYMVKNAQVRLIVVDEDARGHLPKGEAEEVDLSRWSDLEAHSDANPSVGVSGGNLGYIIYTSGSTGQPKGIGLPQAALRNLIAWHLDEIPQARKTLHFSSMSFDVSYLELFSSWLSGGSVYVLDEERRVDAGQLKEYLIEEGIEIAMLPVVVMQQVAEQMVKEGTHARDLKEVITAGEQLQITTAVERLFEQMSWAKLYNYYGPSETHVVTSYELGAKPANWARHPSIGKPIANARAYILSRGMELGPAGVTGELYIGGICLARGYVNKPEMTAEKFVPDPYSGLAGERLYRTGDFARYNKQSEIEYLGRMDDQIKLRGFRVELGEIEATINRYKAVKECVARVVGEGKVKRIVGYVAWKEAGDWEEGLRSYLRESLPEYMVPQAFVVMEALPLTPNGKVDRKALPVPQLRTERAAAPGTPVEEILASIWRHVLNLTEVGVDENFFEIGGHSLLVTQVISRIKESFGVNVGVRRLFETPTIAGLGKIIEEDLRSGRVSRFDPITKGPRNGAIALSSAQRRLWFLDQLEPNSAFYNLPAVIRLTGAFDLAAIERGFDEIVRRHESLRTTFGFDNGEPSQVITPPPDAHFQVIDLTGLSDRERDEESRRQVDEEMRRPFNLSVGPLIRAILLRLKEEEHIALVTMHHIVSDGWSMEILIREMASLYNADRRREAAALPELPIQYADYADWQQTWLKSEEYAAQLAYWKRRLAGAEAVLELPTDKPRPVVQTYRGARQELVLPESLNESIKKMGREAGTTLFMTLLGAFITMLHRYTQQQDISIGSPIAGRNRVEIENLIGCFMNMLVLRADVTGSPTFGELLRRVRETALGAYAHQDLPFERLVEEIQPRRDLSHAPLFQVMFALNNNRPSWLEWEGVTFDVMIADSETAKFDLVLWIDSTEKELRGSLEYNTDLFDHPTITRMVGHYARLLESIVSEPDRLLSDLQMLTESERLQLLVTWNDTEAGYARGKCVHQLIEAQVEKAPDAIALVFGDEELTYRQLNEQAGRLANHLCSLGVGPDIRVGLCAERSIEMVVGILGILKAGGAYVPLDPSYPKERIAMALDDARVQALLTQGRLISTLPQQKAPVVLLENDAGWRQHPEVAVSQAPPSNLAYVIYTSGSTGRPKGVMVNHENVVNFFSAMDARIRVDGSGTWLAVTSISFDISVLELLWTVARGFKVVIQSEHSADAVSSKLSREALERKMDFSLFYFASHEDESAREKYRLLIEGAKFADRHGFAAVWTPERHFHEFGGLYPTPSVTGAAVATITERIDIRAGSVVLPLHNPIRVAEEWAVVDNLSNGRVAISFASGWHASDFALAPDNYENRKEIMLRGVETVRKLWRGESLRSRGGTGGEVEVKIHPRPIQKELRTWLTAAGNPDTFRIAGEIGAGVLTHLLGQSLENLEEKIRIYRESWRKHKPDSGDGVVTLMLHTFVGEDRDSVRETVRGPFSDYLRSSVDLMKSFASSMGMDINSAEYNEDDMRALLAHAFDRYFETSGLFGTPNDCLHMIARLKSIGVDEVACLIDFGVEQESVLSALQYLDIVRRRSVNREAASVEDFSMAAQIARHQVTHLQCTPSMMRMLKADPDFRKAALSLRQLLLGGEALPVALANELGQNLSAEIVNMYGPTETTIWSSTFALEAPASNVPIGKPVVNTEMFILDRGLQAVPIGVPGDLYIGGVGVARGYLDRPELSSESFIPNPFALRGGDRLYRTGDRARRLEDGNIEFLGRDDYQVKIDGRRIELGEIEASLVRYEGVREAVVTVREDGARGKRLAAYVVTDQSARSEISRRVSPAERERMLDGRLSFRLPNGMVVAHLGDFQANMAYREVFEDEIYLRHAVTLNDGDCIFDVGANIGFFSLFANQRCKNLRIFAFEPIPPTFEVLQTNLALFGLNAKLYKCGLSNKSDTAEFTFYPSMAGLSGRYSDAERDKQVTTAIIKDWLKKNGTDSMKALLTQEELDSVMDERFRSEKYICQLKTLSEVIRENNVERIDLLKIDVERSEYDVLCGIESDDWKKIGQIVIEVDTRENLDRIIALLEGQGYDVAVEDYINVEAEGDNSRVDVFMLYASRMSAEWRQARSNGSGKSEPENPSLSINGLRGFLKQGLPEYMIPSSFTFLDALPLTPNGKVDRKSLPEPESLRPELETSYIAPQTLAERTIASIWQEVLGVERVGVHDNFFEIGGTSLLLVQLNSKLREVFQTNIPMVEMFRHATVGSMVNYLTRERDDATALRRIQDRASKQTDTTSLKERFKKARQQRKTTEG